MQRKHFYHDGPLTIGQSIVLSDALNHRLTRVLRLTDGAAFNLFNGRDGLFAAVLTNSRRGLVSVHERLATQPEPATKVLAIGLPKKETMAEVLRQATELGATDIYPLLTRHAVPDKLNHDKACQKLIEAAEQCERLTLPVLHPLQALATWLNAFTQPFWWCYERQQVGHPSTAPVQTVLIGPEGGFSADEVQLLHQAPQAIPVALAAHILRVDTAVVAALAKLP